MRISENRPLAWAVLVVCAIGSIVGLGGSAMVSERNKVVDVFYNGTETTTTTRYSIDAYLDKAREKAQIMAQEAILYLGENCAQAVKLQGLTDDLNSDDLGIRYAAYESAKTLVDEIYTKMYAADLTDEQRKDFKVAYDDFWGQDKYIQKDSYRALASAYNQERKGFPAEVVTDIVGAGELNTFGG